MPHPNDLLKMPVKVQPYEQQKRAFAVAMRMFGVFGEGDNQAADENFRLQTTRHLGTEGR